MVPKADTRIVEGGGDLRLKLWQPLRNKEWLHRLFEGELLDKLWSTILFQIFSEICLQKKDINERVGRLMAFCICLSHNMGIHRQITGVSNCCTSVRQWLQIVRQVKSIKHYYNSANYCTAWPVEPFIYSQMYHFMEILFNLRTSPFWMALFIVQSRSPYVDVREVVVYENFANYLSH